MKRGPKPPQTNKQTVSGLEENRNEVECKGTG